jgi:hypothetical protein
MSIDKNVPVLKEDGSFVCYTDDIDYNEIYGLYYYMNTPYELLNITYQQFFLDDTLVFWTVKEIKEN